jgi:hypothetical protein
MTLQIRSIVLYGRNNKTRELRFHPGRINVITGRSNTGKSAIIEIVDYCLGRSTFTVPEGRIRDSVLWYGIVLTNGNTEIFIAKPAPKVGAVQQSQAYLTMASKITLPAHDDLVLNSTDDATISTLSGLLGIRPNQTAEERATGAYEATFRHTVPFLFQDQELVASKVLLFHSQTDSFIAQSIKDTFPYFLGAIREDRVQLIQELRQANRNLKLLERELAEVESITSNKLKRGVGLIAEAQQVGVLSPNLNIQGHDEVISSLSMTLAWRPRTVPDEVDDQLPGLREEVRERREELRRKQETADAAMAFAREATGYSAEGNEQVARLEAIGVIDPTMHVETCPLCASQLTIEVPEVSAIQRSLEDMRESLRTVERERPRLGEYLDRLETEKATLKEEISERQIKISSIFAAHTAAEEMREEQTTIAKTIGRISLYLESVQDTADNSTLRRKVAAAKARVGALQELLDAEDPEDLLASALSRISLRMSEMAKQLEMEHGEWPFRLDIKKLTVVADRVGNPIPMQRMGGGKNHLGCHLVALLALHEHFIRAHRPVPGCLILDQPSQVYFPSENLYKALKGTEEDTDQVKDADLEAVRSMFSLLASVCEALTPNFQVIVMEHANLRDEIFQDALVEEPWSGEGDRALIPADWE